MSYCILKVSKTSNLKVNASKNISSFLERSMDLISKVIFSVVFPLLDFSLIWPRIVRSLFLSYLFWLLDILFYRSVPNHVSMLTKKVCRKRHWCGSGLIQSSTVHSITSLLSRQNNSININNISRRCKYNYEPYNNH